MTQVGENWEKKMTGALNAWGQMLQGLAGFETTHSAVFWLFLMLFAIATIWFSIFELDSLDDAEGDALRVYVLAEWVAIIVVALGVVATYGSVLAGFIAAICAFLSAAIFRIILMLILRQ